MKNALGLAITAQNCPPAKTVGYEKFGGSVRALLRKAVCLIGVLGMAFSLYADRTAGRIVGRSNSFVTVEGEGSGVTEDGRIWLDPDATEPVTVRARSGWLVNGQESVTVTPTEIRTLRALGASAPSFDYESKTGEDSDDDHSCVAPGPTETNRHERTFSISASSANQLVVYVFPETSVVVTASAKYKIENDGLHVKEKEWEAWSCDQCENSQVAKKERSPYAVEPDTYSWTAEGADLKFSSSEWKGPLSKGLGQDVRFSVTGKCESCSSCECGASAKAVIDVHELHIERPDYLGLDMTDAMKGVPVKRTATAVIDPNPYKATYGWSGGGVCKFLEDEDGNPVVHDQAVTYYATNGMGPSASCGAEMLTVDVSVKNREGLTASATCTTNFTVVKVDVTKDGFGEAVDEIVEVNDKPVSAVPKFVKNKLGEYSEKAMSSIADHSIVVDLRPKDLPDGDIVMVSFQNGELIEINGGYSIAKSNYTPSEINKVKFGLLGNETGYKKPVRVSHLPSRAIDEIDYSVYECTFTIYANFSAYYNDDHEHKLTNDFGHAFWKFDVDDISLIPDDLREYIKVLMGFGPEGDDYFGGPGSVGNEGRDSRIIVQDCIFNGKTITGFAYHIWHIKLDELISGLSYVKGLCEAKDLKYHLLSYNCTDVAIAVGAAAGVDVPCFAKWFVNTPSGLWHELSDLNSIIGEEE